MNELELEKSPHTLPAPPHVILDPKGHSQGERPVHRQLWEKQVGLTHLGMFLTLTVSWARIQRGPLPAWSMQSRGLVAQTGLLETEYWVFQGEEVTGENHLPRSEGTLLSERWR